MSPKDIVEVEGWRYGCIHSKSLLIIHHYGDKDGRWLPSSQVVLDPEKPGYSEEVTLFMPRWLAEHEGLKYN